MYGRPPCGWTCAPRSGSVPHSSVPAVGEDGLRWETRNTYVES